MSLQNKVNIMALQRLSLLDEKNNEIPFVDLWKKGNVIVVFVRHFGCISCRAHVDQIWNKRKDLRAKKNKIVFIGSGTPASLKMFKSYLDVKDATILTDPTLQTFEACGLLNGFRFLMSPKSLKKMFQLQKQGYQNKVTDTGSGSHKQMGGVVAFKNPGVVLYHFASEHVGDQDNPDDWPDKESSED